MQCRMLPELVDMVIEELSDAYDTDNRRSSERKRKRDLRSCTLVARSWYPTSRQHLFRDLVYSFQRDPGPATRAWPEVGTRRRGRWTAAEGGGKQTPLKTLQQLHDFLLATPAIRSSVKELELICFPEPQSSPRLTPALISPKDRVDASLLFSILHQLPGVRDLVVHNFVVDQPLPAEMAPPRHPSLTRLRLSGSVARKITDLDVIAFLSWFSYLSELVIDVDCEEPNEGPNRAGFEGALHLAVDTLFLADTNFLADGCVLDALARSPCARSIRRLVIEQNANQPSLQRFVNTLGPSLKDLQVVLNDGNGDSEDRLISCASCSALETVTLALTLFTPSNDMCEYDIMALEDFLRRASFSASTHPHLRSLVLQVTMHGFPEHKLRGRLPSEVIFQGMANGDIPWQLRCNETLAAIDMLLIDIVERCDMEGIIVECCYIDDGGIDDDSEETKGVVETTFPDAADRGIFRFREHDADIWYGRR